MAARQFARLTKEATYKTFNGSPGAGEQILLHIGQSNSITVRNNPNWWTERSAAGSNRKSHAGTETNSFGGRIMSKLFPSQAAFWMTQAFGITGSVLDLPSFTLDEVLVDSTGTKRYRRTLGCKIKQAVFAANNTTSGTVWSVAADVIGSTPATITVSDFAEPAYGDYPEDNPYVFQQLAGAVTVGASFTNFESLGITVDNILPADNYDEFQYLQRIPWCGRDVKLDIKSLFKGLTIRGYLEQATAIPISFNLSDGVINTIFEMHAKNYVMSMTDDVSFDNSFKHSFSADAHLDPDEETDITVTVEEVETP